MCMASEASSLALLSLTSAVMALSFPVFDFKDLSGRPLRGGRGRGEAGEAGPSRHLRAADPCGGRRAVAASRRWLSAFSKLSRLYVALMGSAQALPSAWSHCGGVAR